MLANGFADWRIGKRRGWQEGGGVFGATNGRCSNGVAGAQFACGEVCIGACAEGVACVLQVEQCKTDDECSNCGEGEGNQTLATGVALQFDKLAAKPGSERAPEAVCCAMQRGVWHARDVCVSRRWLKRSLKWWLTAPVWRRPCWCQ